MVGQDTGCAYQLNFVILRVLGVLCGRACLFLCNLSALRGEAFRFLRGLSGLCGEAFHFLRALGALRGKALATHALEAVDAKGIEVNLGLPAADEIGENAPRRRAAAQAEVPVAEPVIDVRILY